MKKLFLFLVIVLAIVSVSEPVSAQKDCSDVCTGSIINGMYCRTCQKKCYITDSNGDETVSWGPPITSCVPIP